MGNIKLFQSQQIRSHWDAEQELWYFSVIDIIQVLTGSERPRKYWNDLKKKLQQEGSQLSDKIGQLKMPSSDGKSYLTDVAINFALVDKTKQAGGPLCGAPLHQGLLMHIVRRVIKDRIECGPWNICLSTTSYAPRRAIRCTIICARAVITWARRR